MFWFVFFFKVVFKPAVISLQMIIRCDAQHFRVAMNGQHQLNYKHRMKELSAINQVEVKGDVTLLVVRVL